MWIKAKGRALPLELTLLLREPARLAPLRRVHQVRRARRRGFPRHAGIADPTRYAHPPG